MPEFVLEQELIRVKIGKENKVIVDIKQGGGQYDAFILDESLAKAEVVDGVIELEGFANGQTSLIVSDKYSRYRRVPISVYTTDKLQLSSEEIDLVTKLGKSKEIKANVVLGNDGYKVSSDNPAVSVSINTEGVISLTATSKKAEYTANITVTDCAGLSANLVVKVIASLEPFTEEELDKIMANVRKNYYFDDRRLDVWAAAIYLNEVTDEGKQRYGWKYYSYYWCYIDFKGDKSVGVKENAVFIYGEYGERINTPVTLKIIKNDGTKLWGVFSFINDKEEKLYAGYFCDFV